MGKGSDSPGRAKIRVLLVDDHRIMRESLAGLLRTDPDIEVVAKACNGTEAIELAKLSQPDVALMDVTMPGIDGLEATRRLKAELPHVQVIGLSMHEKSDMKAAMREAGAFDYLAKDGPPEDLLAAVRAACGID
jgi:DNA-binding NarL/FixJ family response regulator